MKQLKSTLALATAAVEIYASRYVSLGKTFKQATSSLNLKRTRTLLAHAFCASAQ